MGDLNLVYPEEIHVQTRIINPLCSRITTPMSQYVSSLFEKRLVLFASRASSVRIADGVFYDLKDDVARLALESELKIESEIDRYILDITYVLRT